jgi:threonine dehydratase
MSATSLETTAPPIDLATFRAAHQIVGQFARHTPLLSSRRLSEATGCEVRLKAELFQRTGSYKLRGPLYKFSRLSDAELQRGVICSSAGNHAQGVAAAAQSLGIPAVVVMASGATPSKVDATRGYGAEVILHGDIWEDANELAHSLANERGLTYVHPFDDLELITGQGTVGLELFDDFPEVEYVLVPIGGGGLISGVSLALKQLNPDITVIGVETSGAPAMLRSHELGRRVVLDELATVIDGLKVRQIGSNNYEIIRRYVDQFVALPDEQIFNAMVWVMSNCKLVLEGAAAAPVAALLESSVALPPGSKVACVLSGGNIDLSRLTGQKWN